MSTNSECSFVEVKRGEWWYVLEDYHAPKNAWDWREYATAYGPFSTLDVATGHLSRNHANPGGWSESPYKPGYKPDDIMKKLMRAANRRKKAQASSPYRVLRLR